MVKTHETAHSIFTALRVGYQAHFVPNVMAKINYFVSAISILFGTNEMNLIVFKIKTLRTAILFPSLLSLFYNDLD